MADVMECLQARTQNLRIAIEWIKSSHGEDPQAAVEQLRRLHSEISVCGDLLRYAGFNTARTAAPNALSEYRDCLERLQEALATLRSELLREKSRLQPQREHLQAARAWIQCSKNTLG
jgi:predicted  nucleic acid-binding Zn-ribbon protein